MLTSASRDEIHLKLNTLTYGSRHHVLVLQTSKYSLVFWPPCRLIQVNLQTAVKRTAYALLLHLKTGWEHGMVIRLIQWRHVHSSVINRHNGRVSLLSLISVRFFGYKYLGDGSTDRREILHEGTSVSQMCLLSFWEVPQGYPNPID